ARGRRRRRRSKERGRGKRGSGRRRRRETGKVRSGQESAPVPLRSPPLKLARLVGTVRRNAHSLTRINLFFKSLIVVAPFVLYLFHVECIVLVYLCMICL